MKKLIKLIALAGCLVSASAIAQAGSQWTGNKKVTSVQVVHNGGMVIYLDSEVNPICTNAGTSSVYVMPTQSGVTEAGAAAMLSSSYIALTANLNVSILYDDSTSYCLSLIHI